MRSLIVAALAICLITTSTASAQYISLKDAVVTDFSKKDFKMFSKTIGQAVESATPVTLQWSNPETKASGTVKSGAIAVKSGKECREVIIESQTGGKKDTNTHTFCKNEKGKWRSVK